MAREIDKAEVTASDIASNVKLDKPIGDMELANAVGYREYLEAMDIEGSDKEVILLFLNGR